MYAMTTIRQSCESMRLFLEPYLWVMGIQYLAEITSVRAAIVLLCAVLSLTKKESMWTKSFKEISNCILNPKKHTLQGRILAKPAHSGCQSPDNGNCLSYLGNYVGNTNAILKPFFKFCSSTFDSFSSH